MQRKVEENIMIVNGIIREMFGINRFFDSDKANKPSAAFFRDTNAGRSIVELRTLHDDLGHEHMDVSVLEGKLEWYIEIFRKLGDERSVKMLSMIKDELRTGQKEIEWLKMVVQEIEGDGRSRNYSHLIGNYDSYLQHLKDFKDTRTLKALEKIRKYVMGTEQDHLEDIKKHIDAMQKTDAKTFAETLRKYIDYISKEEDRKIIDDLRKAGVVMYLLNYEKSKKVMADLIEGLKNDDRSWSFFKSRFEKGEIKREMSKLDGLGDSLSSKNLREILHTQQRADQKLPHDEIIRRLEMWLENMEKGEYIGRIEEAAIGKIDAIITNREKELSAIRAKKMQLMIDTLKERAKNLEEEKERARKKIMGILKKREEELTAEWTKARERFMAIAAPIQDLLNKIEEGGSLERIQRDIEAIVATKRNSDTLMRENKSESEGLIIKLRDMESRAFDNGEIREIYLIQERIRKRRMDVAALAEKYAENMDEALNAMERDFRMIELAKKLYEKSRKELEELKKNLGSMLKEEGPAETTSEGESWEKAA